MTFVHPFPLPVAVSHDTQHPLCVSNRRAASISCIHSEFSVAPAFPFWSNGFSVVRERENVDIHACKGNNSGDIISTENHSQCGGKVDEPEHSRTSHYRCNDFLIDIQDICKAFVSFLSVTKLSRPKKRMLSCFLSRSSC